MVQIQVIRNNTGNNSGNNNNGSNNNNSGNNYPNGNNNGGTNNDSDENKKKENDNKDIIKLKNNERNISISIFVFTFLFYLELLCFLCKYAIIFELNSCFYTQFILTIGPLVISFVLNISLLIIRLECHNNYIKLFGKDSFIKINLFLIFLNIFQMFMIILIILFIIFLFLLKQYANVLTLFVSQFVFGRIVIVRDVNYFLLVFVKKKK